MNFLIPERREWSSTPIDQFLNNNFNKMIFRNPIYLIPYDLKIGFSNYGGPGYFNQALSGSEIADITKEGPNLKAEAAEQNFPPYLSLRWYFQ